MKPFNLEEYLKNPSRKVVTREGRSVRILCVDKKGGDLPIIALIQQCTKDNEILSTFTKEGKWSTTLEKHPNDLLFAPEKHEGWINIYRNTTGVSSGTVLYDSREDAEKIGKADGYYMTTAKVEWEE